MKLYRAPAFDPEAERHGEYGKPEDFEPDSIRDQIVEMIETAAADAAEAARDAETVLKDLQKPGKSQGTPARRSALRQIAQAAEVAEQYANKIDGLVCHEAVQFGYLSMDEYEGGPISDEEGRFHLAPEYGIDLIRARDDARLAAQAARKAADAATSALAAGRPAGSPALKGRRPRE